MAEMNTLLEIATDKLNSLYVPVNKELSILPQLMLAVFNEETKDNLDLNMYDRQDMEQEIQSLLTYSDKAVRVMLGLQDREREREISQMLSKASTDDQIREVLISELLFEAMRQNLGNFPNKLRINPVEKFRGEAFL
jgi:hypothetical protein